MGRDASVSPHSPSPFLHSLQTFRLNIDRRSRSEKILLFCSLYTHVCEELLGGQPLFAHTVLRRRVFNLFMPQGKKMREKKSILRGLKSQVCFAISRFRSIFVFVFVFVFFNFVIIVVMTDTSLARSR